MCGELLGMTVACAQVCTWRFTCSTLYVRCINFMVASIIFQTLLSNPAVGQEIATTHASTDGVLRNFCDGNFFRNHGVFSKYPDALQFIMYYDEIGIANPLGAKAGKHKLSSSSTTDFSGKNSDIHQYWSRILFQMSTPLERWVSIRILYLHMYSALLTVHCMHCRIKVIPWNWAVVHGAVVCVCGDTPASCYISGFKEGVEFSLRKCRQCLATLPDVFFIQTMCNIHCIVLVSFIEWNLTTYVDHLDLIIEGASHDSATYGINRASPLKDLTAFGHYQMSSICSVGGCGIKLRQSSPSHNWWVPAVLP